MAVCWKSRGQNELARGYGGATLRHSLLLLLLFFLSLFLNRECLRRLYSILGSIRNGAGTNGVDLLGFLRAVLL